MFTIFGITKTTTQDVYENGEVGQTSMAHINITLTSSTGLGLVDKFKDLIGCEIGDLLLGEETKGRLEASFHETAGGNYATQSDLDKWMKGYKDMYSVNYSAVVYKSLLLEDLSCLSDLTDSN